VSGAFEIVWELVSLAYLTEGSIRNLRRTPSEYNLSIYQFAEPHPGFGVPATHSDGASVALMKKRND